MRPPFLGMIDDQHFVVARLLVECRRDFRIVIPIHRIISGRDRPQAALRVPRDGDRFADSLFFARD